MAGETSMIESHHIANLGVARLGLPVPMAKLVTIQSIAAALSQESTSKVFVEALAGWVGSRELESECLEALCPLIATSVHPAHVARLRQAVPHPSIASDLLLSLAMDNQVLVPSWSGCHSGPVPDLLALDEELQELTSGKFIPPVFGNNLEDLEERTDFPFMRQWAFEYSVLRDRVRHNNEGYLDHFLDSGRDHVGQFVTRQGHLARSAYLRTLAYAADHYGMPINAARHFAQTALPADPVFLRIAPHAPPIWAPAVHSHEATLATDPDALARSAIEQIEGSRQQRIMHCALAVIDTPLLHAELEVFAVARIQEKLDARDVVHFYRRRHLDYVPLRDGLRALVPRKVASDGNNSVPFLPAVMPVLGRNVGYLQFHFLQRAPYLPMSTNSLSELEFIAGDGNFNLRSGDREVGSWQWWLWNWTPGHLPEWPSPIATCTCVTKEAAMQIVKDLGAHLDYAWCITVWDRERKHEKWKKTKRYGHIQR